MRLGQDGGTLEGESGIEAGDAGHTNGEEEDRKSRIDGGRNKRRRGREVFPLGVWKVLGEQRKRE